MLKTLTLLMITMFAFTCPGFSAEEEEAQTRPKPLMRQKAVSQGGLELQSSKIPNIIAERLYREEKEEAQARPNPHVSRSAIKDGKARKIQAEPAGKKMN